MSEHYETVARNEPLAPVKTRPLAVIEAELDLLKQDTRRKETALLGNYIEIGRRLEEAKAQLAHGQWGEWLKKLEIAQSTANNFMRLFREYGEEQQSLFGAQAKSQTFGNLTYSKALKLLAIPDEEERERFAVENDVGAMSVRELEKAIRDREQALADKAAAEEARAKMAEDLAAANALLEAARAETDKAGDAVLAMEQELKELKARPVEVAVETVVDQAAVEAARAQAVAEMQAKLDAARAAQKKAEDAKKAAETKRKSAEAALDETQRKLAGAVAGRQDAEKALAAAKNQLAQPSPVATDAVVAQFQVYFEQAQTIVNQLRGLLLKARGREDGAVAEKLEKALRALSAKIGEAAA